MKTIAAIFVAVLLVASELPIGFSSTAPAFLWSNVQNKYAKFLSKYYILFYNLGVANDLRVYMSYDFAGLIF